MMRRTGFRIGTAIAALAIVATAAGTAEAVPPGTLTLEAQHAKLPVGSILNVEVHIGNCAQHGTVVLAGNGVSEDPLTFEKEKRAKCGAGEVSKLSGSITGAGINFDLEETLTTAIEAKVGRCLYQYTSFGGEVRKNPGLVVEGSGTGTLLKGPRRAACDPTRELTFTTLLTSGTETLYASSYIPSEWNIEGH